MIRSLYSGITGMKANQTKMDVIGNNIANVSTTAFKASRARFQDMLNQTERTAMAPAVNQGGISASQVGLGTQLAGIDTIVKQGMMQPTSRNLDVAIDGEGYFMVGKGPTVFDNNTLGVNNNANAESNHNMNAQNVMNTMYTRDGSFILDHDGNLLTSDGFRVLGYSLLEKEPSVDLAGFTINFGSEQGAGKTFDKYIVKIGTVTDNTPAKATIAGNIITIDGDFDDTTTPGMVTKDEIKDAIILEINRLNALAPSPVNPKDILSKNITVTGAAKAGIASGIQADVNPHSIANNGEIDFVDATKTLKVSQRTEDIDALKTLRIPNLVYRTNEDGNRVPVSVRNYTIDKDGIINAVLETGEVSALGQIAMASFKNPAGLNKLGKNLYQESVNSGIPTVKSGTGEENNSNAKGYGDMLQGMLEMSNVDLAEQFTEMIVTSRAFQANGKVISTGDEILQDILNLKR